MVHLHLNEAGQQGPQDGKTVRLIDIAHPLRRGQLGWGYRQPPLHHRLLGHGGDKPGVGQVNLVHLSPGIGFHDQTGDGSGVRKGRTVAQVGEHRLHVLPVAEHEIAAFPPGDDEPDRNRLAQDELGHPPVEVGVQAAAQPPIRGDGQHSHPLERPDLKQGMDRCLLLPGLGRQVGDDCLDFLGVGAPLQHRRLGAAHLGGGDQGHGVGDLAGVLHTTHAPSNISNGWHSAPYRTRSGAKSGDLLCNGAALRQAQGERV